MPTITIRQTGTETASPFSACVSFEHGESVPVTVTDPFGKEEEERLAWYFEEWLAFPFTDNVKAEAAAQSVQAYGEALFRQLFADPEVFATYAEMRGDLANLVIEIKGTSAFHALHWEALKDPKLDRALSLDTIVIRRNMVKQVIHAKIKPSPTINVLVVTARPDGAGDVSYRTISRPLLDTLEQAGLRVRVDILRPATYRSLEDHLERMQQRPVEQHYHAIHFDVHGSLLTFDEFDRFEESLKEAALAALTFQSVRYGRDNIKPYEGQRGFLFLEGADDDGLPVAVADPVEAGELARLLQKYRIPVAILNACQSAMQVGKSETSIAAELMKAGMQLVVAMGYSVTVSAAEKFMAAFYRALFDAPDAGGGDPAYAMRRARQALRNDKQRRGHFRQMIPLEDWLLPVAYCNAEGLRLATRELSATEADAYFRRKADRYAPHEPEYGFFGRDLDILNIERHVLARNLLLVHGMGGAGKSALLHHLGMWWQRTGFVDEVCYFGWDSKAWNRQQILHALADRLLPPGEFSGTFLPMPEESQQAYLAEKLRGTRHLLILDNLESITGTHLAIKNTLGEAERQKLKAFLRSLASGRTVVLLGSRSPELWLLDGLPATTYDLPGLDAEAASGLADAVLKRHGATGYRRDHDLRDLLKLLAGYPLPIEVVLANLARQTPAEVLAKLREGLESLDPGKPGDSSEVVERKTESLLACVDYSFGNLAEADQRLLLALAPFTGVINTGALDFYSQRLLAQPALADLPVDRWQQVLQGAADWGLIGGHDVPGYLTLQPIFPYFLRARLAGTEQAATREAIETAYRELYNQWGTELSRLAQSKDPQERQVGLALTGVEYENLRTAVELALAARASFLEPYAALSLFLNANQEVSRRLELAEGIYAGRTNYTSEALAGEMGILFVGCLDEIAQCRFLLKRMGDAEKAYQEELVLLDAMKGQFELQAKQLEAVTYHMLGVVTQAQRQWAQAEAHYRQALAIYVEFGDRYEQAGTYHQLGVVAQQQRQWAQAEAHYRQALALKIEFNDRYSQAGTYHQLGRVAQEQRQWARAEGHYRQALAIDVEFNDRYSQASTYHQLGMVAEEQRQWAQAEAHYRQALALKVEFNDRFSKAQTGHALGNVARSQGQYAQALAYLLEALETYLEFHDEYHQAMALRALNELWRESEDAGVLAGVARVLGVSVEEAEEGLRKAGE